MVRYTALSEAARKSGALARYDRAPTRNASLQIGDHCVAFEVPRVVRAYDVVPIRYRLEQAAAPSRIALEAVAFEDARKAAGRGLYDMAIPGDLGVKIEYVGSICADYTPERYVPLTPDPATPVSPYPPFRRDPMVRSSTIRQAGLIWFRFRVTNTGDTILDPEGFGASFASPLIHRLKPDGSVEWTAQPINLFERHLTYLYPGESWDVWVHFWCPQLGGDYNHGLTTGDYRIEFQMVYRYHREWHWGVNIWGGMPFSRLDVPISVTAHGGSKPVTTSFHVLDDRDKTPGYIKEFEEFMTAFRILPGAAKAAEREGTLHLQVAPWTRHVTVKMILADQRRIAVARIPVRVTDEPMRIRHAPHNVMTVDEGGRRRAAILAQAMPGMRTGVQLGPYPERHLLAEIREMKRLGINLIANTAGGWWIGELTGSKHPEPLSAQYKYWYDVLVRRVGMKLVGWSVYPPSSRRWYDHAKPLLAPGSPAPADAPVGYGDSTGMDMADPAVPEVVAAWVKYQHARWGDLWFRTADGRMPIDIEDTWGWMRDDINLRYRVGPLTLDRFRSWAKAKYGTIEAANRAWGSSYASFGAVDPQADQGVEGDGLPHGPVYNKPDHPFRDWSPAVADWDVFRTELRMEFLRKTNALIRALLPGAELAIRTEGANMTVPGDPTSASMHDRHIYYSQRRNAMITDVMLRADVLHFHSDYITLPYTEDEWRSATRAMVASGIIPMHLPQFDHMRDILLNDHYGRDYGTHYGLEKPRKGMMIHCLTAAFPWWKAAYEEGGTPGIIWSDYLCDGFATETQKREVRLLRARLDEAERGAATTPR